MTKATRLVDQYLSQSISLAELQSRLYQSTASDNADPEMATARRILAEATSGHWDTEDLQDELRLFVAERQLSAYDVHLPEPWFERSNESTGSIPIRLAPESEVA